MDSAVSSCTSGFPERKPPALWRSTWVRMNAPWSAMRFAITGMDLQFSATLPVVVASIPSQGSCTVANVSPAPANKSDTLGARTDVLGRRPQSQPPRSQQSPARLSTLPGYRRLSNRQRARRYRVERRSITGNCTSPKTSITSNEPSVSALALPPEAPPGRTRPNLGTRSSRYSPPSAKR